MPLNRTQPKKPEPPRTMTADSINPTEKIHALVISEPGAGKTALAATFPRPYFADCDRGVKVVKGKWFRSARAEVDIKQIRYREFYNPVDKHGVFKDSGALWQMQEALNDAAEDPEIETIVIDSLTTMSELAMVVGLEVNQASRRSQTLSKGGKHPVLLPTQADYGSEMNIVEQILDALLTFDKHVLILAHSRNEYGDSGSLLSRGPLVTGNRLRGKIGKWFDEVWWLDVKGTGSTKKRILLTDTTGTIKCVKSRLGVEDGLEDPTYDKIIASIQGE